MNRIVMVAIVCLWAPVAASAVEIGDSVESVLAELGPPPSEATVQGRRQLFYAGGVVEIGDGKVTHVDPDFQERAMQRAQAAAFEATQKAKGLVLYEGRWIPQREQQARERERIAAAARAALNGSVAGAAGPTSPSHERVRDIRQGGKAVDLASVVVPGKITVVDFYADWCGPCRQIAPHLVDLATRNADVHVVKIDIVNWESEVARQHSIRSIPHLRVFDRSGRPVGSPTSDLSRVLDSVVAARR